MIAALPMYDWPVLQPVNDRFWQGVAEALVTAEIVPPEGLTRQQRYSELWEREDLLFAQTCGLPYNVRLKGRVRYLATPVHDLEGCDGAGYSSAIVVHRDEVGIGPDDLSRLSAVINGPDSWSGCVVLDRWFRARGETMPRPAKASGGHLFSMEAVAVGDAGFAAIDSIALGLARRHLPGLADRLRVVAWTETRPATPFITSRATDDRTFEALRTALRNATARYAAARSELMMSDVEVLPDGAYDDMTPPG